MSILTQAFAWFFAVASCCAERPSAIPSAIPLNELREPAVLRSSNGVLDILLIAKPAPLTLGDKNSTAWIYEACLRPAKNADVCPRMNKTIGSYGGIHLQVEPGDHLKVRLVNKLPPAPADAIHVAED